MSAPPKSATDPLTLLFKSHTLTLFIHTTPTSPLLSIKQQLFSMLTSNSSSLPSTIPIPSSVSEIELGIPVDSGDLTKGWEEVEYGRLKDKSIAVGNVGMVDGGVYAFRVGGGGKFVVEFPREEEEEDEGEGDEE